MQLYPLPGVGLHLGNGAYSCGSYWKNNICWGLDPETQRTGSSADASAPQDPLSPGSAVHSPEHDDLLIVTAEERSFISFEMSSLSCVDGVQAEQLVAICRASMGCFTTLRLGSSDQQVTTLTGQDLIDLNDADKNPDLLFTLDAVHLYSTISAEDVVQFLCGLEEMIKLKELTLNAALNDEQLSAILTRHPNIEKLVLLDTSRLTDRGFSALAEKGSQFQTLNLSGCSKSLTSDCINKLFASLSNMRILTLFGDARIEAEHLTTLLSHASEMTYGHLSSCAMTRESVQQAFESVKHSKLTRLSLSEPPSEGQLFRAFYKQPNQAFKLNDRFDLLIDGQLV